MTYWTEEADALWNLTMGVNGDEPNNAEAEEPFALELDDFLQARSELPPALIGDERNILLPRAGFVMLGGKGGKGKTTLTIDGGFHAISGIEWLGFPIPRSLNVMFIENEGTREMFRRKLEHKRAHWPHPERGKLYIYTLDWGNFDARDSGQRDRLTAFIDEHDIDLVIADPLDSCGLEGVGSPEQARVFMDHLKAIGLHRTVAFWFLHHPRKEKAEDELDDLSGAWGGKPDTVLMLSMLAGDRSRLAMPKMRYGRRGQGDTLILNFNVETESFERAAIEGEAREYADELAELLTGGKWLTVKEAMSEISASEQKVKDAFEGDERFVSRTGDKAKALGRHPNSTIWGLA
jgi:hypothetical protein